MPVELNHTIINSKNAKESAAFLADILGLPKPVTFAHFEIVKTANNVSLDFAEFGDVTPQHYAFLISEEEFDASFQRIQDRNLPYWADPQRTLPNQINRHDGGRGVYFADPSGHYLEMLTRPYGSGSK